MCVAMRDSWREGDRAQARPICTWRRREAWRASSRKDSRTLPELAVATAALPDGLSYFWTATRLFSYLLAMAECQPQAMDRDQSAGIASPSLLSQMPTADARAAYTRSELQVRNSCSRFASAETLQLRLIGSGGWPLDQSVCCSTAESRRSGLMAFKFSQLS